MKGSHGASRSMVSGVHKRIWTYTIKIGLNTRINAHLFWIYENLVWQYVNIGRLLKANCTCIEECYLSVAQKYGGLFVPFRYFVLSSFRQALWRDAKTK